MATVKKAKKLQPGGKLCKWSDKRGGGVSCGRSGGPKSDTYKPGKMPRLSKREQIESDKEVSGFLRRAAAKKLRSISTAPGVRPNEGANEYKKGSQSFFGAEKDTTAAKYGRKVAKKSSVKKAKSGSKVKSIKKSAKKK